MRLGNAEDAKAASEQLGTEHRFVLSQLTETIGLSVTDTTGQRYTSTTGSVSSLAATSWSVSEGSPAAPATAGPATAACCCRPGELLAQRPDQRFAAAPAESESVSTGISTSTAWGQTTSRATGDSESLALGLQRSREFLVEQHELQQLPASAMIITYAGPGGRRVVLADANPGIGGLSAATWLTLDGVPEAPDPRLRRRGRSRNPRGQGPRPPRRLSWRSGDEPAAA